MCMRVDYRGGEGLRAKTLEVRLSREMSSCHSRETEKLPASYAKETKIGVQGGGTQVNTLGLHLGLPENYTQGEGVKIEKPP